MCDDALACLCAELRGIRYTLEVLDIDTNPAWRDAYTDCVPVIVINDKERFRGKVNAILLRRILHIEA